MMMNNKFTLIKHGAVDEPETKADIVGLAEYIQSLQKTLHNHPDTRTSFRDCSRFLISNMGDSIAILRWGLTDTMGRSLTDNWAFQTIEYWKRVGDSEWNCADVDYLIPVDLAADMVLGAVKETKAGIENLFVASVEKGVARAVENGIKRGVDDAMKTLDEIQSERIAIEKRLQRLDELETKAAAREAAKGQRKLRSLAGYVYVIKSLHPEPLYKIGRSKEPDKRTALFGIEVPFDIETVCLIQTDDMYALERELHIKYSNKRVRGEWFNLDDSDLKLINQYAVNGSNETDDNGGLVMEAVE